MPIHGTTNHNISHVEYTAFDGGYRLREQYCHDCKQFVENELYTRSIHDYDDDYAAELKRNAELSEEQSIADAIVDRLVTEFDGTQEFVPEGVAWSAVLEADCYH